MKLTALAKYAGVAAVTTLGLSPARAEIELNKNFSVQGYVSGSIRWSGYSGTSANDTSTLDMDASKFQLNGKFAPVTGAVSVYAGSDNEPKLLDIYGTYDLGGGTTVTAGNFLSWFGYEAFDVPNMLQISYANEFVGLIPAYHTGVKVENSSDTYAAGFAVLDSVYNSDFWQGDGDLRNGPGLEAYYACKGKQLNGFIGLAYDKKDDSFGYSGGTDMFTADGWLQYTMDKTTFAGEFCYGTTNSDNFGDSDSYFWLALVKQQLNDSTSIVGRISGGKIKYDGSSTDPKFLKLTVSPTFALTPNLDVVLEGSYVDYSGSGLDSTTFLGCQGRFKF